MKNLLRTIPFLSENCRYGSPLQRTFRRARLFFLHAQPARETAASAGAEIATSPAKNHTSLHLGRYFLLPTQIHSLHNSA